MSNDDVIIDAIKLLDERLDSFKAIVNPEFAASLHSINYKISKGMRDDDKFVALSIVPYSPDYLELQAFYADDMRLTLLFSVAIFSDSGIDVVAYIIGDIKRVRNREVNHRETK